MKLIGFCLAVSALLLLPGCAPPAPKTTLSPPQPTPMLLSRANPNIVEEDAYHIVERLLKEEYIKVDDRHIRNPIIGPAVEFYKEDDKYYYVYTLKYNAELAEAQRLLQKTPTPAPPPPGTTPTPEGPPLSDFENITPARVSGRIRLDEVKGAGLPDSGMWRSSFVVADMNGDGIPDIVAPPPRSSNGELRVWIGDGKGRFSKWPLNFIENGKPNPRFSIDYGAVAVGDIDGDGNLDIVSASHGYGLVSLFGDGKGTFRVVRTGLPSRNFSAQAIVLLDADGDGKLDIVTSTDGPSQSDSQDQVRVYLYRGNQGWEYESGGVVGGFYSNSLHAWDFDGDGRKDILTGSHLIGALTLLWRNLGNGRFEPVSFPQIEIYAYHFATAPGTFGKSRVPAFADAYYMYTNQPAEARATGITLYSFEQGGWVRHRIWRKKSGNTAQYALVMGDLDGDGLDDIVFADSEVNRLRIFFQKPDGTFVEMNEKEEPTLDSPGQCVRLADLDGDGRPDIVLSRTVASYRPGERGGWNVYLNRR
jgi:hypothetical protein